MTGTDVLVQVRNTFSKPKGDRRRLQFPGGKVDPHETLEQAFIREIQEEIGVTLQTEQFEFFKSFKDPATGDEFVYFKVKPEAESIWIDCESAEPEKFDVLTMLPLEDLEQYALEMDLKVSVTYYWVADILLDRTAK